MVFASTNIHSPGRMRREEKEIKHKCLLLDWSALLLVMPVHLKTSDSISLYRPASHNRARGAGNFTTLAATSPSSNKTMALFMWKKGGRGY